MIQHGFGAFERQLKRALSSDLAILFRLMEGETIYGIALVSDPFIESLQLMINSEESLLLEVDKYEERFGRIDGETHQKYRWIPSLWHYSHANIQQAQLLTINQYLQTKNVEDFSEFELQFYETLIKVLQQLDHEGLFGEGEVREKLTLFISIANDDRARFFENYSARELNSAKIAETFEERYEVK